MTYSAATAESPVIRPAGYHVGRLPTNLSGIDRAAHVDMVRLTDAKLPVIRTFRCHSGTGVTGAPITPLII